MQSNESSESYNFRTSAQTSSKNASKQLNKVENVSNLKLEMVNKKLDKAVKMPKILDGIRALKLEEKEVEKATEKKLGLLSRGKLRPCTVKQRRDLTQKEQVRFVSPVVLHQKERQQKFKMSNPKQLITHTKITKRGSNIR